MPTLTGARGTGAPDATAVEATASLELAVGLCAPPRSRMCSIRTSASNVAATNARTRPATAAGPKPRFRDFACSIAGRGIGD